MLPEWSDDAQRALAYWSKGLLVDSNALIFLAAGKCGGNALKLADLKNCGQPEFDALKEFLPLFFNLIVFNYCIAECRKHAFKNHRKYYTELRGILQNAVECATEKQNILMHGDDRIFKYGFTDVGILEMSQKLGCPVLTEDEPLRGLLRKNGIIAVGVSELTTRRRRADNRRA
jgi:rRNA-processing protein FCF1